MARRSDPLEELLGPLEQDVMEIVWQLEEATVRDVHQRLSKRRKIAYTTVMTTMSRLAGKGLLRRDTEALAHRYRPAVSRDDYARATVASVLGWLVDRYPEPAATYLSEVVGDIDDETLGRLRDAAERRRREER
jgi:predicted transcriptional regulator